MAGTDISVLGMVVLHPLTIMMIVGIAIQGLAECFISPRFLEYFSFQAPKGEEGLYLGFSHLHSFFSAIAGPDRPKVITKNPARTPIQNNFVFLMIPPPL